LEKDVFALGKFVKEHDPTGKLTRAAVKKENARKAQGTQTIEWMSQDDDTLLAHWEAMEDGKVRVRAEPKNAAPEVGEAAESDTEYWRSVDRSMRRPNFIWDDSDE
jgi:hypothetical protein